METRQGHLLQTFEWGELKTKFGWDAERLAITDKGKIVASVQVIFRSTPLGQFAYIPKGPTCRQADQETLGLLFAAIHKRARLRKAIFLKVEPSEGIFPSLLSLGFKTSIQTIQPKTTIKIDLAPGMDLVAKNQKPKTRYNIGLASRKGVEIKEGSSSEIANFYHLMVDTSQRDGFGIHPLDYYEQCLNILGDKARLLLAYYKDELVAGIITSVFGRESIYLYGASGNAHRNVMPNHLLQWEAMRIAKSSGCTEYDLWGIPDEVKEENDDIPSNSEGGADLWGVFRFKKGFGGNIVRFPGAFDYVYSPLKYWVWDSAVPKIQSLRRKSVQVGNG